MSKEKRFLLFGLIAGYLAIFASAAYADGGGFVPKEEVPPDIPYQRAFLSYSDGHELMVVQTKFEGRHNKIGWVVPLPSPPKIATFGGESYEANLFAERFFMHLNFGTNAEVTEISSIIIGAISFALCGLLIASVVAKIRATITWPAIVFLISFGCIVIMVILINEVRVPDFGIIIFGILFLAIFLSTIGLAIDSAQVLKKSGLITYFLLLHYSRLSQRLIVQLLEQQGVFLA